MKSRWLVGAVLFVPFLVCAVAALNFRPVQERLGWRIEEARARLKYGLSPPERIVFVPHGPSTQEVLLASEPRTPTPSLAPSRTPLGATHTPFPTPRPTLTPTLLPFNVQLSDIRHEYQTWNNCGPATLSMALSFWGWEGDQRLVAEFTKPNPRDKNVMPYELADYVEDETSFSVISRVGGDVKLLKQFLAAGLPVIVEKGFEGPDFDGWMGHYVLVTGYDDTSSAFTLQDSYYGPEQVMTYDELERYWRAFNFTYLVVYPQERNVEVESILGLQSDRDFNTQHAAAKAESEIASLSGRDLYFAWFNRGTSLVALQDYAGAAAAYDQAFALYPSIPEAERPWRMLWYQTDPYWAYFYTSRYQDVIDLATTTLEAMSEPVLEESYYWRAQAKEALGDVDGAIEDLQTSLVHHPGFVPSQEQLQRLGIDN